MTELDHHPEPVSLHDCAVCQDRGIEVESREYCQACYRGKRRKNMDSFAEKLRGMPFTDAMWIVAHSTINTERAIAAAELALLKSKLRQAERELAEVRKDADRYVWLRDKSGADCVCDGFWGDSKFIVDLNDAAINEKMAESDAILAAKEQT